MMRKVGGRGGSGSHHRRSMVPSSDVLGMVAKVLLFLAFACDAFKFAFELLS